VVAHDACLSSVHAGKPGRGAENKAWFMAAVELDSANHPQHVRFDPPPDLTDASVSAWARTALHASVHLVTDKLASLAAAAPHVAAYGAIVLGDTTSSKLEVFRWVNTYISNLKTAITGTYHHIDVEKYRARYLAEAQYRVNRRVDLHSLLVSSRQGCMNFGRWSASVGAPRTGMSGRSGAVPCAGGQQPVPTGRSLESSPRGPRATRRARAMARRWTLGRWRGKGWVRRLKRHRSRAPQSIRRGVGGLGSECRRARDTFWDFKSPK
jgi:hypothetical protein